MFLGTRTLEVNEERRLFFSSFSVRLVRHGQVENRPLATFDRITLGDERGVNGSVESEH